LLPLLIQVLEGWNIEDMGSRLTNACMAAVSTACAQTLRSVLPTQPALVLLASQISPCILELLLPFQALEGWLFLGNTQELGSRLTNACMAAVSTSCAQTVRSVLLTQPALAPRALTTASMQELIRNIPSDLFRTCLARVLHQAHFALAQHRLSDGSTG
jgi:hypothetical protein